VVDLADAGERMPIRLVQENGETISLDATSVDIVVERQVSNFGIPFFDAKKMGIDLNQATVSVEVQGVLADELGQEETKQSVAIMDFYQPQQLITAKPGSGKGGGSNSEYASAYNAKGASSNQTEEGLSERDSKGNSAGGGTSRGKPVLQLRTLSAGALNDWQNRWIDLPVAYWVEQNAVLDNPNKTNLQLWLKGENYSDGTWTDSSGFARNATQSTSANKPTIIGNGANGQSSVRFDGNNDYLEIPFATNLNSNEFTMFVVARATITGNKPILDSATNGYGLSLDAQFTNSNFTTHWVDTGGADSKASPNGKGLGRYSVGILGYKMEDTDSNNTSDKVTLYRNGEEVATETSGVDYTGASSGNLRIGYDGSNYFTGDIYEVLIYNSTLSDDDRQNVEGYLARKYGLNLRYPHKYRGTGSYSYQNKKIRLTFDKRLVGTKSQPYGFLNQRRESGLRINDGSPSNTNGGTITVDGADAQDLFEMSNPVGRKITFSQFSNGYAPRKTSGGKEYYATVTAVPSATQITLNFSESGGTHTDNDYIYIEPIDYGEASLQSTDLSPVIVIPISNADTYIKGSTSEEAIGPDHPNFTDGTLRTSADHGADITRTDEYIAFLMSKALTATYIQLGRDIDASSTTPTMDKVFTTSLSESYHGHNARLTITQVYATSLGGMADTINTHLGIGQIPVIQGFSGGKTGKQVKSGGDKAQDLLGILANSNNFLGNPNSKSDRIDALIDMATGFVQQTVYSNADAQGDYIRGIQIPYNTLATKGKDTLDTEVAQRNFFLTTTNARTSDKISSVNDRHASRDFSHSAEGHEKNGISGLVADFNVHRDAEMKAYEFSLVFIAADIIL
jgi:hypothetical protein